MLSDLIGVLLRILYDALFWARDLPEGGRERPLLFVLEEAHAYLGKESANLAANAVRRIAKEGRKYGVGLMIVSQRPSEIDPTILSQCGTIFAMRLANDVDKGHVTNAASDNLKGLFDMLPILRTGEAIIVGEAVISVIAIGAMESVGVKISSTFDDIDTEVGAPNTGQPDSQCVGPFCPPPS